VALQEGLGFKVVTDGELRRNTYIDFVLDGITGVRLEWQVLNQSGGYRDAKARPPRPPRPCRPCSIGSSVRPIRPAPRTSNSKIGHQGVGQGDDRGPASSTFSPGRAAISKTSIPRFDEFWADLIAAYHGELRHLHAAGCTYVQFDETSLIKLVDPEIRA